jgi:hypothetical protein
VGVAAAAAKKSGGSSELEHANPDAAAAVPDTNPLRKHQSQKPVKKQGGDKQGGSKQGGSG